jgi:hypothetical protein
LKYRGEVVAEVWFKPEGEPFALTFRIPQRSFHIPGLGRGLTTENLLKAVGLATEEVESWRHDGDPSSGTSGSESEPGRPLPPPPQDVPHLTLYVSLKAPPPAVAPRESCESEVPEDKWQNLESRWDAILKLEASLDGLRMSMESVQTELEALSNGALAADERVHAQNADVAQWTRAKSRIVYALPKARDFIQRSTWAAASAERKELEEVYKNHIRPRVPVPQMDKLAEQLDSLLKDRQGLSASGVSVYQECKNIAAEVEGALRTVRSNAAANAAQQRGAADARSRSFKRR